MTNGGIIQEYKIIIYYSDFDRYYREDEKVRRNTGVSRDAVENEWETYHPLFTENISALFHVPDGMQNKVCRIICYDKDGYLKQAAEIAQENGWIYQGVCGASIEHQWFRRLFTRCRQPNVSEVYMEEISLAELERLLANEDCEDGDNY
jgi:hypothetical protein